MVAQVKLDIYDRSFKFAVDVHKLIESLPNSYMFQQHKVQLIRSSSSIGANLSEADGALTKKDFINKIGISRREASESNHWLRLIRENLQREIKELNRLVQESKEILLILSSIIKNAQKDK